MGGSFAQYARTPEYTAGLRHHDLRAGLGMIGPAERGADTQQSASVI